MDPPTNPVRFTLLFFMSGDTYSASCALSSLVKRYCAPRMGVRCHSVATLHRLEKRLAQPVTSPSILAVISRGIGKTNVAVTGSKSMLQRYMRESDRGPVDVLALTKHLTRALIVLGAALLPMRFTTP